jgi:Tol biopolymer transport system component
VEEPPAVGDAVPETARNPDIYVMNADGSDKRRITSAAGYDGGPFISPDGQWIVFRTDRKKADRLQIHVVGIDGQNEVEVTDQPEHVNWAPYWHPTTPLLIWTHADHSDPRARPNYDLFIMPYTVVDGKFVPGEVTRITDAPAADVLPVFSPDGTRLMWTSTRTADGSSQLFIADFHLP